MAKTEVNKVITKINEFVHALVKKKAQLSEREVTNLLKFFSIPIPKVSGSVDFNHLKTKEFIIQSNFKLVNKLYKVLNKENDDF